MEKKQIVDDALNRKWDFLNLEYSVYAQEGENILSDWGLTEEEELYLCIDSAVEEEQNMYYTNGYNLLYTSDDLVWRCPEGQCLEDDDRLDDLPKRPIEEADIADVDADDSSRVQTPPSRQVEVINFEYGGEGVEDNISF
ncbi:hypothetical protein QYM36_001228 [Artemia franciscana]|uniref:Uncharacterized protein n=1 Tax=Artemia franciscana TaxID=6661 RepID=A0AA88LI10_ARTSF|nr:hypothetical protein QYM36_001228 [Artemia franciscana]